jgi:CheY-like chemotaxis protein
MDSADVKTQKTILVAEDDVFLRKLLSDKLKKAGFLVMEAVDGKEALSFLGKETPDLVLLDLIMPNVDGFQVLQNMRKDPRVQKIPVIVLLMLAALLAGLSLIFFVLLPY